MKDKQQPPERNLKLAKYNYDCEKRLEWIPPSPDDDDFGVKLLTMPNIPKPLHSQAPRSFMGATVWDKTRKFVYKTSGERCAICGCQTSGAPGWQQHQAHEYYTIDYKTGTSVYSGCVNLCKSCHLLTIHTGRALTLYKYHNPIYDKKALLAGAEKAFKLIHGYNIIHPDEPLRLYATWMDYIDNKDLHDDMVKLADKYKISFWSEDIKNGAKWGDWKLIYGKKEYPTKFKDVFEWAQAMAENNEDQQLRSVVDPFAGRPEIEELKKLLKKS